MTKTIMLACAGGMSTSLLVTKMRKAAKKRNIDVYIFATASAGLKSIFETGFKRHSEPRLPSTAQINH
ncbi:hypothetical protein CP1MG86_MNBNLCLN_00217 [Companilactobacillus paralimentarius]|uniref:PTS sugar transporter subunit IIB n=2 Tax=Companilactobacillus paralimentarius TaxID=83526 RepID=UPI00126602A7|nr:hypothetical protein LP238_12310 [Companilactobacillus paralimentarius]